MITIIIIIIIIIITIITVAVNIYITFALLVFNNLEYY